MISSLEGREIIFEYRPVGKIIRVAAVDTITMTEIVISCPKGPQDQMQNLALKRLEYVMKKKGILE